jgi:hypothetical protein
MGLYKVSFRSEYNSIKLYRREYKNTLYIYIYENADLLASIKVMVKGDICGNRDRVKGK